MELQPNEFSEFALNRDEELAGFDFSLLNRAVLQNERTRILRLKISLGVNHAAPAEYIQEEAYLRGALEELEFLIIAHENLKSSKSVVKPGETPAEETPLRQEQS